MDYVKLGIAVVLFSSIFVARGIGGFKNDSAPNNHKS